jgi:hypothetical protein
MRSLLIMAAVAATAILLSGCPDKKPEPVPGPQSALRSAPDAARNNTASANCPEHPRGVSGISWFQGTLEEGFSPRSAKVRGSSENRSMFHY